MGELPGGKRLASPKELKVIIAARKDELAQNLAEKLMAYALCRQLEGCDKIVVDRLLKNPECLTQRTQRTRRLP